MTIANELRRAIRAAAVAGYGGIAPDIVVRAGDAAPRIVAIEGRAGRPRREIIVGIEWCRAACNEAIEELRA